LEILHLPPPPLVHTVYVADSLSLTQLNLMLLNLVSNAVKFTEEGVVTLSASMVEEFEKSVKIKFAVTDTGVGIPKDKREGIFGMLSQSGGAESRSEGFGIGLSIVQKLTEVMGGALDVMSPVPKGRSLSGVSPEENNEGSEFSFTLALDKAEEVAEKEVEEKEAFELPVGMKVLIVDDSMANRKLMNRKLCTGEFKELEWKIMTARTGEGCLEMLDAGSVFDLIVMDENMQDAGGELLGTETTELIRKREDGGQHRALVFGWSGNSTEEDKEKGRESGQDWFWSKPAPPGEQALQDVARLWAEEGGREKGRG